jgi:hypothetical protein
LASTQMWKACCTPPSGKARCSVARWSVILSYYIFDGSSSVQYLLKINKQSDEIVDLKDEINNLNLKIQLNNVAISKNNEELKKLKEENNDLQEELLFYEKIVGKRR